MNDERAPLPDEYANPQPVAVDTAGDEIAPLPDPNYLSFPSILADVLDEADGSFRASRTLTAHELANAVRLAEVRWRHRSAPDSDA